MNTNSSTIDVDRARQDTPGVRNKLHFNNAGAALMPRPVLDAVIAHLNLEAEIGGYEAEDQAQDKIMEAYTAIAQLINCNRDEIAFVENATRAWDMGFYSVQFKPGDRIITAMCEYASNFIAFLQIKERTGVEIDVIPNDETGQLDVEALKNLIDDKVKLIAITHVPTNGGLVSPVSQVGQIARAAGIPYLLDACQSVGQMQIDVDEIGCDMLSATGRKFLRGPRATGFLYVRRSLLDKLKPPFLDLHAADLISPHEYRIRPDARRFENWESNYAGKIGLATAVNYAMDWGLSAIEERVVMLANRLRAQLKEIPGIEVHDLGRTQCAIVSFTTSALSASTVKAKLDEKNINVSTSSPLGTRLDMEARGLSEIVRASVHYYNTEEEIDRFCKELHLMIKIR